MSSHSDKFFEAYLQGGRYELFRASPEGVKYPIYLRAGTSDILNYRGIFERKEYEFLQDPVNNILDLGGYIGLASIYFANRFPRSKIFLVEPDTDNYILATLNCRGYENITCLNYGAWSHSCILRQTGQVGQLGGDFGKMFNETANLENEKGIEAKSVLELINMAGFEYLDLCKIDIEGSEKVLFDSRGVFEWLNKCKIVSCEFHDRMVEGCSNSGYEALHKAGFKRFISGEYEYFVKSNLAQASIPRQT